MAMNNMYKATGGSPRGSPPSANRPPTSQTQPQSQQAHSHQHRLQHRRSDSVILPQLPSTQHQYPRTSPTIVPRGVDSLSRKNKLRSHSFHSTAPPPFFPERGTKPQLSNFQFTDCFHSHKGQEILLNMWETQELCDVTLCVEGREIKAHKVVLASSSAYFRAMFTCGLSESSQSKITLDSINSADIMQGILRYFYTSKFTIEPDLVQEVIPVAEMLQVVPLKEACAQYLLRQLSVTNCLGVYAFADVHNCQELHREALSIIQRNFAELVLSSEFKLLSYSHVLELVSLDRLSVPNEAKVFDAIVHWISHKPEERKQHLKELLLQVRLPLLDPEFFFDQVSQHPLIGADPECNRILMDAMQWKVLPDRASSTTARTMVTPRQPPGGSAQVVTVFGGMGRAEPCASAEVFIPSQGQWHSLPHMRVPRWGSGVAVLGREVYIAGGSDSHTRLYSVERFDVLSLQWSAAPHLTVPRNGVGLVGHKGCLYAIGGFDGQSPLRTVEKYSPISGHWTGVAGMLERRYGVGAGVMDDVIYVIGGTDVSDLKTAECYDTETDQWLPITAMHQARKYPGVVMMGGCVYTFGGCDGQTCHSSVEVYHPSMEQWVFVSAMPTPRSGLGVAHINGYIYVMGGSSSSGVSLCSVDQYDPLSDRWQAVAPMNVARDKMSATVLEVQKADILSLKMSARTSSQPLHIHVRQYSS